MIKNANKFPQVRIMVANNFQPVSVCSDKVMTNIIQMTNIEIVIPRKIALRMLNKDTINPDKAIDPSILHQNASICS